MIAEQVRNDGVKKTVMIGTVDKIDCSAEAVRNDKKIYKKKNIENKMVVLVEKEFDKIKINKLISGFKPTKIFVPQMFAGKMKWSEEPLEYQKRLRNEWT